MEQLIYAFASKATEPEAMILVESIREFKNSDKATEKATARSIPRQGEYQNPWP